MASAWADHLPTVAPPLASDAKPITLIYPFYQCGQFFKTHLAVWRDYPAELRSRLAIVVVDDGSPTPAALPPLEARPCPMRLFRIGIDVPWNWLAARNIGAHYAADGWILISDIDHLVPIETLRALMRGAHDPAIVYAFRRIDHHGARVAPHSASFFLTRDLFWRIGGYDEALSGYYGTDGDFRRRIARVAPIHVLPDVLIRWEFVEDSSTTRYPRKLPSDADAIRRIVKSRDVGWRPRTLSFPYEEITSCST